MHRHAACCVCGEPCPKRKQGESEKFVHCAAHKKVVSVPHGASARDRRLLANYGITHEDYLRILAEQGGGCAICGTPPPKTRSLDVDHSHTEGTLRGLLCSRCNQRLLPAALDDPELLARAAAYLRREPYGFVPTEDEVPAALQSYRRRSDDGPNSRYNKAPGWLRPKGQERNM